MSYRLQILCSNCGKEIISMAGKNSDDFLKESNADINELLFYRDICSECKRSVKNDR